MQLLTHQDTDQIIACCASATAQRKLFWRGWATAWAAERTRKVSPVFASCALADFALLAFEYSQIHHLDAQTDSDLFAPVRGIGTCGKKAQDQ